MTNNQSHKSTWYYGVMVAPAIPWNSNLLEPCALKGARTVLRREGDCEVPDLSDQFVAVAAGGHKLFDFPLGNAVIAFGLPD